MNNKSQTNVTEDSDVKINSGIDLSSEQISQPAMPVAAGVESQSNTVNKIDDSMTDEQEIVTFVNDDAINLVSKTPSMDPTKNYIISPNDTISAFFKRPVKATSFQWTVGGSIFRVYSPWTIFFSDPSVQAKIKNFYLARCNLKVLFQINGTPFHYGQLLVSYHPFPTVTRGTQEHANNTAQNDLMEDSQKPHGFLSPTTNNPLELEIPFHHYKDWFKVDTFDVNEFNIGDIIIRNITNTLSVASASATTTVDISVYIYAENFELAIPTSANILAESDDTKADEYDTKGMISGPANIIKNIADALKKVPLISKLATATSIGAGAVASIAKLFGFSKPIQIEDEIHVRPTPFHNMANTLSKDMSTKLTFDPKQETTIDTSIAGLASGDHMTIAHIAGRETYIDRFIWSQGSATGTQLFWAGVSPMYSALSNVFGTGLNRKNLTLSSMAFASLPFKYWSGTIIYRVVVVASKYHKGRMRISYEPNGAALAGSYNTAFSHVVDLSDGLDYEFSVSWAQDVAYKDCCDPTDVQYGGSYIYDSTSWNGTLYFSVVNELTAPLNTANVEVLVFARAGPDFEVFNPKSGEDGFSIQNLYLAESEDILADTISLVGEPNIKQMTNKALVYHGDPIHSFRALIKRFQVEQILYGYQYSNPKGISSYSWLRHVFPTFTYQKSENYVTNGTADDFDPYNTSLIAYLSQGYMGWRGGLRYKFNPNVACGNIGSVNVDRVTRKPTGWFYTTNPASDVPFTNVANYGNTDIVRNDFCGTVATNYSINSAIEVEFPYYNKYRFCILTGWYIPTGSSIDGSDTMYYRYRSTYSANQVDTGSFPSPEPACVQTYVAAAEDFNLIWYLGSPTFTIRV